MNKQLKRFIGIGLTISLASVPTLSEVSKSKEISEIQEESFSLLSTDIDNALLSMEADRLTGEDFALSTLKQPGIDNPSEGMEDLPQDLPEQQQAMKEHAETFLDEYSFELKEARNRTGDIAAIVDSYMATVAQKVEEFENGEITEEKARNDIQLRLERLNTLIEREARTVEQSQERLEDFHIDLEKDYNGVQANVTKVEEVLIEQGDVTEEEVREFNETHDELYSEQINLNRENLRIANILENNGDASIKAFIFFFGPVVFSFGLSTTHIPFIVLVVGGTIFSLLPALTAVTLGGIAIGLRVGGVIPTFKSVEQSGKGLSEMTSNLTTSVDSLSNKWNELQKTIQTMIDKVASGEHLSILKTQFEESSIGWRRTQDASKAYQQLEGSALDTVEIDLDETEIDNEEYLEEILKEAHGSSETIETSELTDKELEDLLRDLLEEELDEAA